MQQESEQGGSAGRKKKRRVGWVYSVLPVSMATGPLGPLVQLYLIQLNGQILGTIYASLAFAMFNGVSIPASMFWGYATDRLHNRKTIVVVSYALTASILFAFYFLGNTPGTILVYSVFSFISAAAATPLNLLIMETEHKGKWANAFARLSMISSLGNVGGLVLSTLWGAGGLPLILLSIPLGTFSLASAVLAFATISEPAFVFERETIVRRRASFFTRFLALPLMFLTTPGLVDFRRLFRGLRFSLTSYLPLFYISTVCFYLSSGVFNTSLVPALSTFSLSTGEVFAVILSGMVVQTLAFRYAGRYFERRSLASGSIQGLLLRGGCYVLFGVFALVAAGPGYVIPALILYPLASGVAFAAYYISTYTMMFNAIQRGNAGSALGVYSAVIGVATLAGSLGSGFISVFAGFHVTFISAGLLLFLAAAVVTRLPAGGHTEGPHS
ncbi:MAG: MFS transporter [Thaumarchaeota archaeon]|nr:MAG: MFS transporter [Nitrososphaerota archaeon]